MQVDDEPRGAAAGLNVPGDTCVERDLPETLGATVEPVAGQNPGVPDGHGAFLHHYRRYAVPEASVVQAPQVQIGSDDDPVDAVREPQATTPQRAEWSCEVVAAPALLFRQRARSRDRLSGVHRISVPGSSMPSLPVLAGVLRSLEEL